MEKLRVRYLGNIWTVSKQYEVNRINCYRLVRNEGLTKIRHHITQEDFDQHVKVLGNVVEENTFSENYSKISIQN